MLKSLAKYPTVSVPGMKWVEKMVDGSRPCKLGGGGGAEGRDDQSF